MKDIDPDSWMLVITVGFFVTVWTLVVVIVAVVLPNALHLKTPWPLVALAWVAPVLPYLWKRLRSSGLLSVRPVTSTED